MPGCVGLDVAKAQLDIALRPSGARWAVPNHATGVTTLVDRLPALHPTRMVLEATGGLERAVTSALATAGLPVVVGHPRQVRAGARATGQRATTEALEAHARAHCAAVIHPPPRPRPAAQTQALHALLGRRQPRIVMRTAAPHRRAGTSERRTQEMAAPMPWRKAGIATLDDASEPRLRASPLGRDNDALWQRDPGLGPVGARTVVRALPACGTRTRQQSAAVVGVAPRRGASGTLRGRRPIWGGRAHGRPVFSMGTLVATRDNPQSNVFDERLLTAGQGNKVALTACMHTRLTLLNTLLKHRTPWQPQEVQN